MRSSGSLTAAIGVRARVRVRIRVRVRARVRVRCGVRVWTSAAPPCPRRSARWSVMRERLEPYSGGVDA